MNAVVLLVLWMIHLVLSVWCDKPLFYTGVLLSGWSGLTVGRLLLQGWANKNIDLAQSRYWIYNNGL